MNKHPEQKIQHKIMNWCRDHLLKVYGTANGQFINTWSAIRERGLLGKGLPDLFILIPAGRSNTGSTIMVCMEVKSATGRATKEQKEFISLVESIKGEIHGVVVHGFDEAVSFITSLLAPKPELTDEEAEKIIKNM